MDIKITVSGPNKQSVQDIYVVTEDGELTESVGKAIHLYRVTYPLAEPFDYTLKVEHA